MLTSTPPVSHVRMMGGASRHVHSPAGAMEFVAVSCTRHTGCDVHASRQSSTPYALPVAALLSAHGTLAAHSALVIQLVFSRSGTPQRHFLRKESQP
eukprot:3299460-Rhodomonas_salina.2